MTIIFNKNIFHLFISKVIDTHLQIFLIKNLLFKKLFLCLKTNIFLSLEKINKKINKQFFTKNFFIISTFKSKKLSINRQYQV